MRLVTMAVAFLATALATWQDQKPKVVVKSLSGQKSGEGFSIYESADNTAVFRAFFEHDGAGSANLFTSSTSPKVNWKTAEIQDSDPDGNDKAKMGEDFAYQSGQGTFPNDSHMASFSFDIDITNDNVQEMTEVFDIEYSIEPGVDEHKHIQLGNGGKYRVVIRDNEAVTLAMADAMATEGVDDKFVFAVQMSHKASFDVELSYAASMAGRSDAVSESQRQLASSEDVEGQTFDTLVLKADNLSVDFNITIKDDNIQETVETFEVSVNYFSDVFGLSATAKGMFLEEHEGVTVCIESVMTEEDAGEAVFTVLLSHKVGTDVAIKVETVPGNSTSPEIQAVAGSMYSSRQDDIVVKANSQSSTFTVDIEGDNVQSPFANSISMDTYGRVNFGVKYEVSTNVWAGGRGNADSTYNVGYCGAESSVRSGLATGYIFDFEDATLAITAGTESLVEGDSGSFTYSVTLSHAVSSSNGTQGFAFSFENDNTGSTPGTAYVSSSHEVCTSQADQILSPSFDKSVGVIDVCFPLSVVPWDPALTAEEQAATEYSFTPLSDLEVPYVLTLENAKDDAVDEGDQTFTVGIHLPASAVGYRVSVGSEATVGTILDNDVATLSISGFDEDASEDNTNVFTFSVTLSHTLEVGLKYPFSVSEGSARKDVDWQHPQEQEVEWLPYQQATAIRTVQINIVNNDLLEENETLSVTFTKPKLDDVITDEFEDTEQTFSVNIVDNERTTLLIQDMHDSKEEGADSWLFTVYMSHASESDMALQWETTALDGSVSAAAPGTRYTPMTVDFKIEAGQTKAVIDIADSIINDDVQNGLPTDVQNFAVKILAPAMFGSGSLVAAVLIHDDEDVTVMVHESVVEEGGENPAFKVSLSHAYTGPEMNLFVTTTGGSATSLDDFNLLVHSKAQVLGENGDLVIGDGEQSFDVPVWITDDNEQEMSETFTVKIVEMRPTVPNEEASVTFNGWLNNVKSVITNTITITDFEGFLISISNAECIEGADCKFKVSMDGASADDVTVKYRMLSGGATSAVINQDFGRLDGLSTGNVTIEAGQTDAYIVVPTIDDNTAELTETFEVLLQNVVNNNLFSISQSTKLAVGSIGTGSGFDEDPTVSISSSAVPATRGDDFEFTVSMSHIVTKEITVTFETKDSTARFYNPATGMGDYVTNKGEFTFEKLSDAAQLITVKTKTDACQGKAVDKTFEMKIDLPTTLNKESSVLTANATLLPFEHDVTIFIENGFGTECENCDITFNVQLSHCISDSVNLTYTATNSDAEKGVHYMEAAFGATNSIVIPASTTMSAPMGVIKLPLINDDFMRTENVSFTLSLVTDSAGISVANNPATGVIADDEDVTISITECVQNSDVNFNADISFTVKLSHSINKNFDFTYHTISDDKMNLNAVAGKDYVAVNNGSFSIGLLDKVYDKLMFEAMDRKDYVRPNTKVELNGISEELAFPVRFGVKVEFDEDVLSASNVRWQGPMIGKAAISDPITALVSMPRVTATEGETAVFSVTVDKELHDDVTMAWAVSANAGSTGFELTDVVEATGTIILKKNTGGAQTVNFNITMKDDFIYEMQELFDVSLTVVSPSYYNNDAVFNMDGVEQAHVLNENDEVILSIQDAVGYESEKVIVFQAQLSSFYSADVSATFVLNGVGTAQLVSTAEKPEIAMSSTDYWSPLGTTFSVSFPADTTPVDGPHVVNISITLLDDTVLEPEETFELVLQSVETISTIVKLGQTKAVGTIVDVEKSELQITTPQHNEESDFEFEVFLGIELSEDTTLTWTTIDNDTSRSTAVAGTNYKSKSGFFTLRAGLSEQTQKFSFEGINNIIVSDNLTVGIAITSNNFNFGSPQGTFVLYTQADIIDDNEEATIAVTCPDANEEHEFPTLDYTFTLSHEVQRTDNKNLIITYSTPTQSKDVFKTKGTHQMFGFVGETFVLTVDVKHDDIVELKDPLVLDYSVNMPNIDAGKALGYIVDDEGATMFIMNVPAYESEEEALFSVFLSHEMQNAEQVEFYTVHTPAGPADELTSESSASIYDRTIPGSSTQVKDMEQVIDGKAETMPGLYGFFDFYGVAHIKVPIINDDIAEVTETFAIKLTDASYLKQRGITHVSIDGTDLGFDAEIQGVILDDEDATISFSAEDRARDVHESDGEVTLAVKLSHFSEYDLEVSWATIDGYATSVYDVESVLNKDFDANKGTVKFSGAFVKNAMNRLSSDLSVTLIDDHVQEHDHEDFCVQIQARVSPKSMPSMGFTSFQPPSGGPAMVLTFFSDAYVTLIDDNEHATVMISDTIVQELEAVDFEGNPDNPDGIADMTFAVTMSHPVQSDNINVHYRVDEHGDNKAKKNVDYEEPEKDAFVTIARSVEAGPHEANLVVKVYSDMIAELDETLKVTLTNIEAASQSQLTFSNAEGSIKLDVDKNEAVGTIVPQAIGLIMDDVQVMEGSKQVTFTIKTDKLERPDRDIKIEVETLSASDARAYLESATHIINNQAQILQGDVFNDKYVEVAIPRAEGEVQGFYDFTPVAVPTSVTLKANQTSITFSVDIEDDDVVQRTQLFVARFVILNKRDTYSYEMRQHAVAEISDNDSTEITIGSVSATESNGQILFPVTLSKRCSFDIDFNYNTEAGSALTEDIVDMRQTYESSIKALVKDDMFLVVQVTNDNVQEESETFKLQLSNIVIPQGTGGVKFANEVAVGTITDDEDVTVFVVDHSADESSGNVRFQVTLSHVIRIDSEIVYSITHGTAQATDFTSVGCAPNTECTLQFSKETPVTDKTVSSAIAINIINDDLTERHETFMVNLLRSSNKIRKVEGKDSATFTIENDDMCTVTVDDSDAAETDGEMIFNIKMSHVLEPASGFISVDYSTRTFEGASSEGVDAGMATGTPSKKFLLGVLSGERVLSYDYVIPEGSSSLDVANVKEGIKIQLVNDDEQECDETFELKISDLKVAEGFGGMVTFSNNDREMLAIGTINNDDEGLQINIAGDTAVSEGALRFQYTVTLSHSVDRTLKFNVGAVSTAETNSRLTKCQTSDIATCFDLTKNVHSATSHLPAKLTNPREGSVDGFDLFDDKSIQPFGATFNTVVEMVTKCKNNVDITYKQNDFTVTLNDNEDATIRVVDSVGGVEGDDFAVTVALSHNVAFDQEFSYTVDTKNNDALLTLNSNSTLGKEGKFLMETSSNLAIITFKVEEDENPEELASFNINIANPSTIDIEVSNKDNKVNVFDDDYDGPTMSVGACYVGNEEVESVEPGQKFRCDICRNASPFSSAKESYGEATINYVDQSDHDGTKVSGRKRYATDIYKCIKSKTFTAGEAITGCGETQSLFKLTLFVTSSADDVRGQFGEEEISKTLVILDDSSTKVALEAVPTVKMGTAMHFTVRQTGGSCPFAFIVPLKITAGANVYKRSCEITENQDMCSVHFETEVFEGRAGDMKNIDVEIDQEEVVQISQVDFDMEKKTGIVVHSFNKGVPIAFPFACKGNVDAKIGSASLTEASLHLLPTEEAVIVVDLSTCFYDADVADLEYTLTFADGRVEVIPGGVHAFSAKETDSEYDVTVTAIDEFGETAKFTLTVEVATSPAAKFISGTSYTINVGETIMLSITEMTDGCDALITNPEFVMASCTKVNSKIINVRGIAAGRSQVCLGTQDCFEVVVRNEQTISVKIDTQGDTSDISLTVTNAREVNKGYDLFDASTGKQLDSSSNSNFLGVDSANHPNVLAFAKSYDPVDYPCVDCNSKDKDVSMIAITL